MARCARAVALSILTLDSAETEDIVLFEFCRALLSGGMTWSYTKLEPGYVLFLFGPAIFGNRRERWWLMVDLSFGGALCELQRY